MDYTEQSPVILSFCTGIRGIERGIERVVGPITVAAYVEIEAFAVWNLVAAMESGVLAPSPIWTDVKTFPAHLFRGKIFLLIGGYPCQPFSVAGNQKGEQDPRHLFPYIASAIYTIRPHVCFFENVTGHLTCGFDTVKRTLEGMGYRVEAGIYSAEEVGAPHRRERLFILAVASGYMANADGTATGRTDREIQGAPQRKNGEWVRHEPRNSRQCMANTIRNHGAEVQTKTGQPISGQKFISYGDPGRADEFPSRPGEQYDWEEPRTTQSGVGCTAHGYNFREDLLRALGNGVVEQTAELAFRDLLRKHLRNGAEQNI